MVKRPKRTGVQVDMGRGQGTEPWTLQCEEDGGMRRDLPGMKGRDRWGLRRDQSTEEGQLT